MEATSVNPFVPRATVIRFPNSTFEARIHLPGAAAHIDVVPHGNFILVTGSLTPRVRPDSEGRVSTLLFSDQPCGVFGRDIPVNLAAGTEIVVLSTYQDCDDYVIRYTVRNSISPRPNCADIANANAAAASGPCPCPPGQKGSCGRGIPTAPGPVVPSLTGTCAVPPALLHRGSGVIASAGYGPGRLYGYGAYGYGYGYAYGCGNGASYPYGCAAQPLNHPILHPNGGATSL